MRALRSGTTGRSSPVSSRAFALATALVLVTTGSATALGGGLPHFLAVADASVADMIGARSPGMRQSAYLTKIKAAPRLDVGRIARALPRIRNALPAAPAAAAATPVPAAALVGPLEAAPVLIPTGGGFFEGLPASGGGGGVFFPGGGFPGIGGIGGGGGGVVIQPPAPTPETPPVVQPPPPATVPEPAAWATLILGFGTVGSSLRARRRRARCDA